MKLGLHLAMATEACAIGKVCIDFPGCVCHTHTHKHTKPATHFLFDILGGINVKCETCL